MKLRSRILLMLLLIFLVGCLLAGISAHFAGQSTDATQSKEFAYRVLKDTYEFSIVSQDFLLAHNERPLEQMQRKLAALSGLLNASSPIDHFQKEQYALLGQRVEKAHALLQQIVKEYSDQVRLPSIAPNPRTDNYISHIGELAQLMSIQVFEINDIAKTLFSSADTSQQNAFRKLLVTFFLCFLGMILASTLFAASFSRLFIRKINVLKNGIAELSAGRFNHPIILQGKDEFAELAVAFNQMSESLRNSHEQLAINHQGLKEEIIQRRSAEHKLEEINQKLESLIRERTKDLEQTNRRLAETLDVFNQFIRHSPIYTYIKEVGPGQSKVLQASGNLVELTGILSSQMIGKTMEELFPTDFAAKITNDDIAVVSGGKTINLEEEFNGRSFHTIKFPIHRGDKTLLAGYMMDITERKLAEEKIQQMAYHDSLTGLPNRELFSDRLGIALAHAQRNKKEVGVAMLDLDNFKGVNDTLGHTEGDLLLQAAAERLTSALRKGDTVARIGGDEFVLILPELKGMEDAIQVAQKIVDSFRKPFLIDTHQLVVTTSIGIAVYPNDGTDERILMKNADIAMYQAKQAGRDRYRHYKKA